MSKELELRQSYLDDAEGRPLLQSIYFGGGTPSLLETQELETLLKEIARFFEIAPDAEITLEANPDDLTEAKLQQLATTKINRLSIGIQSFFEEDLRYMNRAHNATEARKAIENAQKAGFENLTIDLIYGTPTMNNERWQQNLETVFALNIPHLSCYCLTVEPKTALEHFVKVGKSPDVNEAQAAEQFEILLKMTAQHGFEQYEISNFAKNERYAQHNTNYWKGKKYLGIGASAHSFDGNSRQWNISNNARYIQSLEAGKLNFEREALSEADRLNEYLMTGLRTKWGVDLSAIQQHGTAIANDFLKKIHPFLIQKLIQQNGETFTLTPEGRFLSDGIIGELFF